MTPIRIMVEGASPYEVAIGKRIMDELPTVLATDVRKVLLVHSPAVAEHAARAEKALKGAGLEIVRLLIPDAEAGKNLEVASEVWSTLGRQSFTRTDAVVAVGGGAVTDVTGFVAANWLRGVRWVAVPTTLLGMVDAAVGGKTGVNTPEGKNLVGAFHPPAGVLCDLDTLATLPVAELTSGMAEVVKVGFVSDPSILELVESGGDDVLDPSKAVFVDLIDRAVRVKARVVGEDLRDAGLREILNYGHTLGHAIERVEGFRWRHGEAVSVGLVYSAELAHQVGRLDEASVKRHRTVLTGLGLPTSYARSRWPDLLAAMRRDKKARGSTLRFVVLDGIGRPGRLEGPDDELLTRVFEKVSS
jgi:3-dehydroquinate synthase